MCRLAALPLVYAWRFVRVWYLAVLGRNDRNAPSEAVAHEHVREWDIAAKCVRDNVVLWYLAGMTGKTVSDARSYSANLRKRQNFFSLYLA